MMEEQKRCVDCGQLVNRGDESYWELILSRILIIRKRREWGEHPVPELPSRDVRCPDCARKIYTTFWR